MNGRHVDPLRFRRRFAREAAFWGLGGAYWRRRPSLARRRLLALGMAHHITQRRALLATLRDGEALP